MLRFLSAPRRWINTFGGTPHASAERELWVIRFYTLHFMQFFDTFDATASACPVKPFS